MKRYLNKCIVILGQTSTGKSDFAVEVAKELKKSGIKAEIISADSRQVYKGMNLGTGKITKKEMQNIPHHLLDVVTPKKVFSVNNFKKLANQKIKEIYKRDSIPIICGGTGFYIDTLINNTPLPNIPPNKKLRKQLNKESADTLYKILKKVDPRRAKTIDKNNKVRLIRAIEIVKTLGKVPNFQTSNVRISRRWTSGNILKIGMTIPNEILKKKIKTRLISRIKKGMIKEIEYLHAKGLTWKRMDNLGLEYRYGALYLQNKLSKEEMLEKLNIEIWHFAKRQKTWFKRDPKIIWINPLKKRDKIKIIKQIKEFCIIKDKVENKPIL